MANQLDSLKTIHIRIEGVNNSPLSFNASASEKITDKLFINEKGKVYLLSDYLKSCGRRASKQLKQPRNARSNWESQYIACVTFPEFELKLTPDDPKVWIKNAFKRMVHKKDGNAVELTTPMARDWACEFDIIVDECKPEGTKQEDIFTPEVVRQIFEYAGKYIGIGNWTKGGLGRFIVSKWE